MYIATSSSAGSAWKTRIAARQGCMEDVVPVCPAAIVRCLIASKTPPFDA